MVRRVLACLLLTALTGCSSVAMVAGDSTRSIKGVAPTYGPGALNTMPNGDAVADRIWAPDLDLGFDPQGLAVAGDQLLVSGYRSLAEKEHSGPCWLVRVAIASGQVTGRLPIPAPCRHGGGVTVAPDGTIAVSDTNSLFVITGDAFGGTPSIRRIALDGFNGAFTTFGAGALWIGTSPTSGSGQFYAFDPAMVGALADGQSLKPSDAKRTVAIPANAQGATIGAGDNQVWIASSDIGWGKLDAIDLRNGNRLASYQTAAAVEGIAFDGSGRLWAASEAGVRHYYGSLLLQTALRFHPILFQLRTDQLK